MMGWFWLVCLVLVYFLPSIAVSRIGKFKGHPQAEAIIILNVLLGWTFLGWVVALVWAATYKPKETPPPNVRVWKD